MIADVYKRMFRRGTVCQEWTEDYSAFESWAKDAGYMPGKFLKLHDRSSEFSPENCFFAYPENSYLAYKDYYTQAESNAPATAEIKIRVPQTTKTLWQAHARVRGMSLNEYLVSVISQGIADDEENIMQTVEDDARARAAILSGAYTIE